MKSTLLKQLLPFLRWLPLSRATLRADFVAGLTVALVLVPQSMAYAQLAAMPAYYGLYAAFLPVIVAALWGSSSQLATGPVAVVSLLTASSLSTFAAAGSEGFIALAIMLALLVGLVQFTLGVLKLGVLVNFLSHPVIVGFTNAAALIIGLSQLNKLLGVPMDRTNSFMRDIWRVLVQVGDAHGPTLLMGLAAVAIIAGTRRYAPRWPGVLIAVLLATSVSWLTGFERSGSARTDAVADPEARARLEEFVQAEAQMRELGRQIATAQADISRARNDANPSEPHAFALRYQLDVLRIQLKDREQENRERMRLIRRLVFERAPAALDPAQRLHLAGELPAGVPSDGARWRIESVGGGVLKLNGGGLVVGAIPSGLPSFGVPQLSWDAFGAVLSAALVIALVGFMEAVSIAKAMAARTKQRIDPNQELIGQGLANIVGAFSQSFPVSGSFSRSAVNINAGAQTGMSSVFSGLFVLLTLLLLTPLLHHLPQAVLAAVIIMAVVSLVNFAGMRHAWQASRHDGIASATTFVVTLAMAPHLDIGILVGTGLAIVLYLLRTMKPRVVILGRHPDGSLRDARAHNLPASEVVTAVRFDGRLYFANVSYFEDAILEAVARNPKAKYLLVVGNGINEMDASGEEVMRHLVERLRSSGVNMIFSGLKEQVVDVMRTTGLHDLIGERNIHDTADAALHAVSRDIAEQGIEAAFCLLPQR